MPRLPVESLLQIGFDEDEALLPNDKRVFHGFDLVREYFMFPRKFLGFRLINLDRILRTLKAKSFDLIFTFNAVNPRLPAAVGPIASRSTPRRRSTCSRWTPTASR